MAALSSSRVPASVHRMAYRAQQLSMLGGCLAAHRVLRAVAGRHDEPDASTLAELRGRYDALLERDLTNADAGLYPRSLLLRFPYGAYAKSAPLLAADLPRVVRRLRSKNWRDLPSHVDLGRFPPYFRRTFHWQTDGYFSHRSAARYDVGVELLFLGMADVMRRQIIPPVTEHVRRHGENLRVLDVATGTGRALRQLAWTHPRLAYTALDLSPWYLDHARRILSDVEDLALVPGNAEQMPFRDAWFDVVTCVHLFHELPRNARRNVYREMLRVLRPGGLLVIEDSAQRSDSPAIDHYISRFSDDFHEPFHRDYADDDIGEALRAIGFDVVSSEPVFVAKVVTARKPRA